MHIKINSIFFNFKRPYLEFWDQDLSVKILTKIEFQYTITQFQNYSSRAYYAIVNT